MSNSKQNVGLTDAARLLDLVPFLLSHQGISLKDLADQFAVTTDEITADLTTLWMCGLPGYTAYELIDLSFDSGYVTISNAETLNRPRNLERNEALALLLGLETLLEEIDSSNPTLTTAIESLISKISLVVDQEAILRVKAGTPGASILRAKIAEGMDSRQLLKILYHTSSHDKVSERLIQPLEMVTRNDVDYVEAFCHSTNDYRTFRLDRMFSADFALQSDEERPSPLVADQTTFTAFTVRVEGRVRDIVEQMAISEPHIETGSEVHLNSYSSEWALREVMSLGGAAVITSPEFLRSAARTRAERALKGYSTLAD